MLKGAIDNISKAVSMIDSVCRSEQFALNNVPENLQDSDRALQMEDNIDVLSDASEELGDIKDTLTGIL